jgi:hypothetical protein
MGKIENYDNWETFNEEDVQLEERIKNNQGENKMGMGKKWKKSKGKRPDKREKWGGW